MFQYKVLQSIVNASWCAKNNNIHRHFGIFSIKEEIRRIARKYETKLNEHTNLDTIQLLDDQNNRKRVKRTKPVNLIYCSKFSKS